MISLFSPAKINCFLRVFSKGKDMYHPLASLFRTVSLGDHLTIEFSKKDQLICDTALIPLDSSNLILQAIHLFRLKTGITDRFTVNLDKKVPIEAGLGGGSSNASTTLWGLNKLCRTEVPTNRLALWSSELGSDQAFFFSLGTAYCTGRGENVTPVSISDPQEVIIVKPSYGLSTKQVFSVYEAKKERNPFSFEKYRNQYFNDLETPAFQIKPSLELLKNKLLKGGFHTVVMSGSGTSFFCLGEGTLPSESDLNIFKCHFIERDVNEWYSV
jgi:4-diphosphocytidyl-2-C-methyl-D-erythritol kinase